MAITKKRESIAALRLCPGKTIGTGWLFGSGTIGALSTDHAFPYIDMAPAQNVDTIKDSSIQGQAFEDVPQQAHIWAPCDNMLIEPRYVGMGRILY